MSEKEFLATVESVLEWPAGSLQFDTLLVDTGWDSLAVIGLIAEFDRRGLPELAADAISSARTVRDLFQSIFVL